MFQACGGEARVVTFRDGPECDTLEAVMESLRPAEAHLAAGKAAAAAATALLSRKGIRYDNFNHIKALS